MNKLIDRLPPLARYPAARLIHLIGASTYHTPPAHFLAAAIVIPLTAAVAMWLLSFLAWLLPYLLILISAFYVVLGAIAWARQRP